MTRRPKIAPAGALDLFGGAAEPTAPATIAAETPPAGDAAPPIVAPAAPTSPDLPPPREARPERVTRPRAERDPESVAHILEGLNPEQRSAVTHGDGPLLIVAGAGTGKTQVVTRRIAWLIATKRARPEQILALTYTEKAAAEMEARVDELVPYGFVGATICTFHAFGDRLLREHGVELGLGSHLRVESRAEIKVFLRERLFELGLERYLPLGKPDTHLDDLVGLFDRARDEDVSPEAYLAFAEGLGAAAQTEEERDRAAMEVEKARAFAAYQKLILEHGRIDFGAQIGLALRLLRERPWLRREYQERWRHVLVDEFQDTNHVQWELLQTLAGARRNLTVVGDDDQSIYRFRGAKVENLLGFRQAFPEARTVVLVRNYRSGQRILDAAHRLIQYNNPARLEALEGLDKRLRAERDLPGEVEHAAYRTASDEADAIAADIEASLERGTLRPGDVAVLAREHRHLEPVAAALRYRGIPFQRSSARGLYSRPEVQLCLDVLRSVADPDDGPAVFGALGHPMFAVDPVDLARLSASARRRNAGLLRTATVAMLDPRSELSDASRAAIGRFAALHRNLADAAVRRPTTEVLHQFAEQSGLLEQLAAADSIEAVEQAKNLSKLFRIVQRIGPLLREDRVDPFVSHLDLLIAAGDDPSEAELEFDEEAVHLLTAHNAKGLEFPVVYLVQLASGRFPGRRRGEAMALPPELQRGRVDERADHDREERRLFYVAATRARDRLVLTHAADYGGKTTYKASPFVVEALGLTETPRPADAPSALQSIARFAPAAEPVAPEAAPLAPDAPLTLSHQQIDDFLTCPLKYRYAHVLQIPLHRDPRMMFGSAIHHAIHVYLRHRLKGYPAGIDEALRAFDDAWSSEGFYTREHEELRQEEGRAMLRRFVEREEASGVAPLAVEQEFRFAQGPDTVVGRFDRIDERDGGIVLVDYKTANVEEDERAAQRTEKSLAEEQLGLYALAYQATRRQLPKRVELHFVESGRVGAAEVGPAHLAAAQLRVAQAGAGIRAARFPARPDPARCGFCPYSRFCPESALRPKTGA
jgi:DNA helicase II / ATP-dependent DNA helicase PcrA